MVLFASRCCCHQHSLRITEPWRNVTSSVSPIQRMTPKSPSRAAFVLLAMNCDHSISTIFSNRCCTSAPLSLHANSKSIDPHPSNALLRYTTRRLPSTFTSYHDRKLKEGRTSSSSPMTVLLSLCPTNVQPMPESVSWLADISPVNAPLGLSNTFCAATSMPLRRCSRARRRYRAGGAITTSAVASQWIGSE